jgi:hypothetical protein
MSQENQTPESPPSDDLPDWLRELRGDDAPSPEAKDPPSPPVERIEPEVADDEELPDWLQDVDAAEAEEQAPEVGNAVSEPAIAEDAGDDLWKQILAEEGLDLEDIAEERPAGAEDMSVEDWMAATAGESAKRQAKAQLVQPKAPEPEPEVEAPSLEVEDDGIVVDEELPDWLKSDQPAEAEAETKLSWFLMKACWPQIWTKQR